MSVQRGGGGGYSSLDLQHELVTIDTGNDLATGNTENEQIHRMEPLGGLQRDEVAELVALVINVQCHGEATDEGSDVADVYHEMEVSFDAISHLLREDSDVTTDVGDVTGFDTKNIDLVDVDPLYHYMAGYNSGAVDSTDGHAVSPFAAGFDRIIPFRQLFGEGPTVDRHDEIYWHTWNETIGSANGVLQERTTWYWDVSEI